MHGACGGQKRVVDNLDLKLTNGCESPGVCWEQNLCALNKQSVILTAELALKTLSSRLKVVTWVVHT